jgi:gluconate 2-dehydrogenase gamma chain
MERRSLLKWMVAVPAAWSLPLSGSVPDTRLWRTLEAVQAHLLPPGTDAPSAASVGATSYLYRTMRHSSFDFEIRDFIFLGAGWAEREAMNIYGRGVAALEAGERERVCRILLNEYERGEAWLSTLLTYTLEALLSDPIYGGNRDESGWKWLHHVPGSPRPRKRFVHGL